MNIDYNLKSIKNVIANEKPPKVVLVTSLLLLAKLEWEIKEIQRLAKQKLIVITIPNGEEAKEWQELGRLLKEFIKNNIDRSSLVIALGGGSVTDMVGFACSIYKRGVKYINVSTTLLGMVDASIGGKTGINFSGYKNQLGTFSHPITTIIDTKFLKHLSADQISDGFAEIIKSGLIKDRLLVKNVEADTFLSLARSPKLKKIIQKSIAVKDYFTNKDPNETNIRQLLNFGHTVGHAVEVQHKISHGKAVFIGMLEELRVGESLKITSPKIRVLLEDILKKNKIYFDKKYFRVNKKYFLKDKKVVGEYILLPAVEKVGKARLVKVKLSVMRQIYGQWGSKE